MGGGRVNIMQENSCNFKGEEKFNLSKKLYKILTDDELFELLPKDKLAEEEFYNRYKEKVKRFVSKYKLDYLEKQDLIQEGMIGLFKAIETYKKELGIKFSTYSRRCIENQIKNALNSIWKHKLKEVSTEESGGQLIENYNPEYKTLDGEFISNIQNFLDTFGEIEKKVVEIYLENKSYKAISEELNISKKRVDNILRKIRKKLSVFMRQSKEDESNL